MIFISTQLSPLRTTVLLSYLELAKVSFGPGLNGGRLLGCFVRLGVSGAGCLSAPALVVSPPLVFSLCCSLSCVASLMADVPKLSITLLGAGQEVGRSCCVLQYRGRTIVCDAGVHPAYSGIASLPFIDELDWSTVDVLLITQYVSSVFLPPPVLTVG